MLPFKADSEASYISTMGLSMLSRTDTVVVLKTWARKLLEENLGILLAHTAVMECCHPGQKSQSAVIKFSALDGRGRLGLPASLWDLGGRARRPFFRPLLLSSLASRSAITSAIIESSPGLYCGEAGSHRAARRTSRTIVSLSYVRRGFTTSTSVWSSHHFLRFPRTMPSQLGKCLL